MEFTEKIPWWEVGRHTVDQGEVHMHMCAAGLKPGRAGHCSRCRKGEQKNSGASQVMHYKYRAKKGRHGVLGVKSFL